MQKVCAGLWITRSEPRTISGNFHAYAIEQILHVGSGKCDNRSTARAWHIQTDSDLAKWMSGYYDEMRPVLIISRNGLLPYMYLVASGWADPEEAYKLVSVYYTMFPRPYVAPKRYITNIINTGSHLISGYSASANEPELLWFGVKQILNCSGLTKPQRVRDMYSRLGIREVMAISEVDPALTTLVHSVSDTDAAAASSILLMHKKPTEPKVILPPPNTPASTGPSI